MYNIRAVRMRPNTEGKQAAFGPLDKQQKLP
jgi:hypothetical protein